jgi:hypothetical protein
LVAAADGCAAREAAQEVAARAHDRNPDAAVLVIDDGSTDGSFEALRNAATAPSVRVLRNEHNLGYAGNFVRLFEEAETDYLLVASDDDDIVLEELPALRAFLDSRRPAFVSTQFLIGGELYRGRNRVRPVEPEELFFASSHAPGLVYRVAEVRPFLGRLRAMIDRGDAAATVYPQVLTAAYLLLRGGGVWWNRPLVVAGEQFETGITIDGETYTVPGQRWRQHLAFLEFFDEERKGDVAGASAMAAAQQKLLFYLLRSAIKAERPDLVEAFDAGARRFCASRLRLLVDRASVATHDPAAAARAVRRRLRG